MSYRNALVLITAMFIVLMFLIVPLLTSHLGSIWGSFTVFLIYWFFFCLPLGWFFQRNGAVRRNLSLALGGANWVPWAVAAQITLIAVASWFMLPENVPLIAMILAFTFGTLNGFLEEFFWRGAFLEQGRGNMSFQLLGVGLFTLWHVPLVLAHGVHYEGGPAALIGGALFLGIFWFWIANRTDRIGWSVVAHMFTNVIAFVGHITVNFV